MARGIIIVILGVVQLVGVHTDFAFGSLTNGCVDGIVGILEINTIIVFSITACSIDIGRFVQVCSIGDRNRSAVIQIELWIFNTGFDIRNAYHKRVIIFKMAFINFILRRIAGDIIGVVIGINDYTIECVISNALGQGIIEQNSVLVIVIVSTVGAFGQLSDQPELELFVDCMVSGTAPTVIVTSRANVVVVDFLLNSGFFSLRLNWKVKFSFANLQQEGIAGMIGIASAKVGSINDQIITCPVLGDFDDIAGS